MPRIKRWFPVSQSINQDPEIWEMTEAFGERALRVWLEILSIGDRNEGVLKGTIEGWAGVLMSVYSQRNPRWVNRDLETLQRLLRWLSERGLIIIRDGSESLQKGFKKLSEAAQKAVRDVSNPSLIIVNYGKYHKTWELERNPIGIRRGSLPSEPSEPSEPIHLKKDEYRIPLKRKTKKSYPDDFEISVQLRQWCTEQMQVDDPEKHLEAFRDHHTAKGSRFLDWDAAFRNWIRRSFQFQPRLVQSAQREGELSLRTQRILKRGL